MRAVIAVTALLGLVPAVSPGPVSAAGCHVPRHGVVLRTAKVRVWRTPGKLLACTPGHAPRVLIKRSEDYPPRGVFLGDDATPYLPTRPQRLAARGYVVAYGALTAPGSSDKVAIWARDLKHPLLHAVSDDAYIPKIIGAAFEFPIVVGDLQIGPRGDIAAIICPRYHGRSRRLARTCLRPGSLDSVLVVHPGIDHRLSLISTGRSIQPHSLHADGSRFSWIEGRRRRHARFRESSRPEDCAHIGRTVARSSRVRILRRALPGNDQAHASLSACRLPRDPIRALGGNPNNALVFGDANLIDGDPIAGAHIAYETTAGTGFVCLGNSFGPAIVVTGRDPARVANEWAYPSDFLAGRAGTIVTKRLYVTPAGSAVWSASASAIGSPCDLNSPRDPASNLILAINGATGEHLTLAHDSAIDPDSLRLHGHRASWLNVAVPQHADLP
jgi:hypothetical protein